MSHEIVEVLPEKLTTTIFKVSEFKDFVKQIVYLHVHRGN